MQGTQQALLRHSAICFAHCLHIINALRTLWSPDSVSIHVLLQSLCSMSYACMINVRPCRASLGESAEPSMQGLVCGRHQAAHALQDFRCGIAVVLQSGMQHSRLLLTVIFK
jgi:hypothetical protein